MQACGLVLAYRATPICNSFRLNRGPRLQMGFLTVSMAAEQNEIVAKFDEG
jgi:hypothetical protein